MARFIGLAFLAIIALVAVTAGGTYVLGPHLAVIEAFNAYKAAYLSGDADKVTVLTTDPDIEFWDQQRKLALTGNADVVKALDFKHRAAVLRLRTGVIDKHFALEELQSADARKLYSLTRDMSIYPKVLAQMDVMFALPTGTDSARGYVRMTQLPPAFFGHHQILALATGLYYNFEQQQDGQWLVDPTPMLDGAAHANEQLAIMMEPTGNTYLALSYNPNKDPAREVQIWEPLVKQ